jgi:hypothetical protein
MTVVDTEHSSGWPHDERTDLIVEDEHDKWNSRYNLQKDNYQTVIALTEQSHNAVNAICLIWSWISCPELNGWKYLEC